MGLQADLRAAAVTLFTDYAADAQTRLQVYRARPATIMPPTAFVDSIRESIVYTGPTLAQRTPVADCIVIHGIYDSGDAADQKDAFCDGFVEWVKARYHASGANTLCAVTDLEDLPNYVPEWMAPENQKVYYATRISLEGFALN